MRPPHALTALLLVVMTGACGIPRPEDPVEPPVLPTVTGMVLHGATGDPITVTGTAVEGEIVTYAGGETEQFTARFFDDTATEFTPASGFGMSLRVDDTAIAATAGQSGWTYRVRGVAEGATTMTVSVHYEGVAEYTSPALPIRVDRLLETLHWLSPDTLNTIVTAGPVAIEVAPLAGSDVTRVSFRVNGVHLVTDTSPPFTASWDPTRFAAPGLYELSALGMDSGGQPLAADTLLLMVPQLTGTVTGRYGGVGDDRVYAMLDDDGATVLAGELSVPSGGIDACVLSITPGGNRWVRAYGGSGSDHLRCLAVLPAGGYVVGGWTTSLPDSRGPNAWVMRLNEGGAVVWSRILGAVDDTQYVHALALGADGSAIVAGERQAAGESRLVLVKLNAAGDVLWSQEHGGPGRSIGYAVAIDGDGFMVTGLRELAGQERLWMLRANADGSEDWSLDYALGGPFNAGRALLPRAGGWAVLGGGDKDLWLLGLDPTGDQDWSQRYGDGGWDQGFCLTAMPAGGYLLGGVLETGALGRQLVLVRTDGAGNQSWLASFGDTGADEARALFPHGAGALVAGVTDADSAGGADIWLMGVDATGNEMTY